MARPRPLPEPNSGEKARKQPDSCTAYIFERRNKAGEVVERREVIGKNYWNDGGRLRVFKGWEKVFDEDAGIWVYLGEQAVTKEEAESKKATKKR